MFRSAGLFIACLLIFAPLATGVRASGSTRAAAPAPVETLVGAPVSAEAWGADLDFLVARIEALHPDPFKAEGRAAFDARVVTLRQGLPSMSREEAVVGLLQLVASLRDGHSGVPAEFLLTQGFEVLPLRFQVQEGALYLVGADRHYGEALGACLVSVSGIPAEEVYRRVLTVVPHDNDFSADLGLPSYLVVPQILRGLKITRGDGPVMMEFERDRRRIRLNVAPIVPAPYNSIDDVELAYTAEWVNTGATERPLWLRHLDRAYWFEFLPDSNTLFVQYNQATSDHRESMPAFVKRMRAEIAARKPDRLVLDLRHNPGGEAFWNKPLLLAILKSEDIDQRGKLFVLIGRRTFSAGSLLAHDLERYSKATFIGEPTGGAAMNFGNHERVVLPNSGLPVMIATVFYQNGDPFDQRRWIPPQLAAPVTPADYAAGLDPGLAAAIAYKAPADQLLGAVRAVAPGEGAAAFTRFRTDPMYRYLDTEPVLVTAGYELIRAGDHDRAIAIFTAGTLAHPHSANMFDSLGDAYKAAGRKDDAIASYRKALAIAPGWQSARASLEELGVAPPPAGH